MDIFETLETPEFDECAAIDDYLKHQYYWNITYNKMIQKPGISESDKDLLWKIKEIYKDNILDEILSGSYEWSIPEKKAIAKDGTKKKRIVYVYNIKDRYILGVMYRAISAYFRNDISSRCFSYKSSTNTSDAIKYLMQNKKPEHSFGVKVDIHAYFNSVSEEKVKSMINELFSDGLLITIQKLMLDTRVLVGGKVKNEWKSLIPGCAFGSFFANYCLKHCDEYFEKENKIYARYSDDIIVLEESKEELQKDLDIILKYIGEYGLTMNPDKYTWFNPGDSVEYLGLKIDNNCIDISDHAKKKIKKQIHRWCRKGRMEIERDGKSFDKVAHQVIRRLNNRNMFCMIDNESTFGWCQYAFRYITTTKSLREIDLYTRDTLRAMKTGKHNKNNVKAISDDEFKSLGWVSLVDMYKLYKQDYDYYTEIVELMKNS